MNMRKKFICIEDCVYQEELHSIKYLFKIGEEYQYDYKKSKWSLPIYKDGVFNGDVRYTFIDRYFLSIEDYSTLKEIDKWFDYLLQSKIKIKKIKKLN